MKLRLAFESRTADLAGVRHAAREFLEKCGFEECAAQLLILALDEACTNIIRYAYCNEVHPVRLDMIRLRDRVRITIRDYGTPCDPSKLRGRDLEDIRPGGLGIHIIKQVFDHVEYLPCSRGTRLTLEKMLGPQDGTGDRTIPEQLS